MSAALSLYWTGACRHPQISTRRDGALCAHDYPMFAAVIERNGARIVVDPGYAPRFFAATEPFPERLYRWTTPATCPAHGALCTQLGAGAADVTHVVLTHFHADHMAGLIDFPNAKIVASRAAWNAFRARRGFGAVSSGYLKTLAPEDIEVRLIFAEDLPRVSVGARAAPFDNAHDLFGDASVLLIDLPGHAEGQIGALIACADGADRFLIADSTWSLGSLMADAPPPWPVMRFLGAPPRYRETWARLRALAANNREMRLIPAHCTEAAAREGAKIPDNRPV